MKPFESFLAPQLDKFIAYREALGYTMRNRRGHLLVLDRYLKDKGAEWSSFEPSFFLRMRTEVAKGPRHTNQILLTARVFFRFLLRLGYVEENPLQDVPLLKENVSIPFIFSRGQTDQLLAALCRKIRRKEALFLTDLGIYLLLVLLARCGMRISEPLGLMVRHYRKDDGTLYIEKTKFRKDRLIPLPKAVIAELDNYLSVRKELSPDDQNPYLLAGKKDRALPVHRVRHAFHQAVEDIGLKQQRRAVGNMIFSPPVPHCLRHSFAVNTLKNIIDRGDSARDALPMLATYLGHSTYFCSSIYLKIADAQSRNNLYDFTIWQEWKI
jgi:site-specific recombinase XerD